jgi:hypothetical protein
VKKINVDRGTERQDLTLFRIEHNRYNVVRLYKVTDLHPYSLPNANWWRWGLTVKPRMAKLIMPENQPFLCRVKKGCSMTDVMLEGFIPMWGFFDNEEFIEATGLKFNYLSIDAYLKYVTFWRYETDGGYKSIGKDCLEDMLALENREAESWVNKYEV